AVAALLTASSNDLVTTAAYNASGEAVYAIDGAGDVTQTAYDRAGRVTQTVAYATALTSAQVTGLEHADGCAGCGTCHFQRQRSRCLHELRQCGAGGIQRCGIGCRYTDDLRCQRSRYQHAHVCHGAYLSAACFVGWHADTGADCGARCGERE